MTYIVFKFWLPCTTTSMPNIARISVINDTGVYHGDTHIDFTGDGVTNSTGPPPAREKEMNKLSRTRI